MAYAEKIINREEVGKKKFVFAAGKAYIFNSSFRPEEVEIDYVEIVRDSSTYPKNSPHYGANGIIGAVLAGVIGVLAVAAFSQVKWDIDFDIHLKDGRVVEIRTIYADTVKRLTEYMVEEDPRAERRRLRGV